MKQESKCFEAEKGQAYFDHDRKLSGYIFIVTDRKNRVVLGKGPVNSRRLIVAVFNCTVRSVLACRQLECLVQVNEIVAEEVDPDEAPREAKQADAAALLAVRFVVVHAVGIRAIVGPVVSLVVAVAGLLIHFLNYSGD